MEENPYCHWCGQKLIYFKVNQMPKGKAFPHNFATIDHLIDRYDPEGRHKAWKTHQNNTVLACYSCNVKRAKQRTLEQSKSALQIRNKLGQERKTLGQTTPRDQVFRNLDVLNKWDDSQKGTDKNV